MLSSGISRNIFIWVLLRDALEARNSRICLGFLSNYLEFLSTTVGRRPARGIAARISRLDCGEFLKLHQWQITAN
jgi:hypothetical protein